MMDTTADEEEDIAMAVGEDSFVGLEEDVEIKATMATLSTANTDDTLASSLSFPANAVSAHSKKSDGVVLGSEEDCEIPVAIPVEGDVNSGEVAATNVDDGPPSSAPPKAEVEGSVAKTTNKESFAPSSSATNTKRKPTSNSTSANQPARSKSYQNSHRSAFAAHRHRHIPIPPIGSPGLLMLPSPALTVSFPPMHSPPPADAAADRGVELDPAEREARYREEWFHVHDGGDYLLPQVVFRQSMVAGGYGECVRGASETVVPHRGSSTEREVGDMFDNDAGGLYLHFPELIPWSVWERRVGDDVEESEKDNTKVEGKDGSENGGDVDGCEGSEVVKEGGCGAKEHNEKGDHGNNDNRSSPTDATNDATDPSSSSSVSKKNNAREGPKGARSSYIFFTNAQRPKMVSEFPRMRFTEQGVIMGERWRALTPEERRPYEELANRDKERYAGEMAKYIEGVKREIRDEKLLKEERERNDANFQTTGTNQEEQQAGTVGPIHLEDSGPSEGKDSKHKDDITLSGNARAVCRQERPRLVDAVILSLSKMLGETLDRREEEGKENKENEETQETPARLPASEVKPPDQVVASNLGDAMPEQVPSTYSVSEATRDASVIAGPRLPAQRRRVSPELPHLQPASSSSSLPPVARTRKRPRPHSPPTFLDMAPISLTSRYPPSHVAARRSYAAAVLARERDIEDAQEAADDFDDAHEKYASHCEAWDRMLEYQKGQIAKREAERRRKTKEKEEGPKNNGGEDIEQATNADAALCGEGDKKESADMRAEGMKAQHPQERTASPPPEDPMECMPARPLPPGPARIVSIPNIPSPPSLPLVIEMEHDNDYDETYEQVKDASNDKATTMMRVPKLNRSLLGHLDPSCFLPSLSGGQYFGLLSNHIADPQFVGIFAPGIAGNTCGGGTGLATSYAGGGRGPVTLVGAPAGVGGVGAASSLNSKGGSSKGKSKVEMTPELLSANLSSETTAAAVDNSPQHSSSDNEKRGHQSGANKDTTASSPKKKSKKRNTLLGLAVGDRNTTATEISSGSAGPEFPDGWMIKTYRRSGGETIGKTVSLRSQSISIIICYANPMFP